MESIIMFEFCRRSFIFIWLFLTSSLQSDSISVVGRESNIVFSNFGMEYSPINNKTQFLNQMTVDLLVDCALNCHSNANCQVFNYDQQSHQCRIYNGDTSTTGSIVVSSSSQSIVGSIEMLPENFAAYENACSQCENSRYLECISAICQCPSGTFYDASICQNQRFLDGQCSKDIHCRTDANLKCSSFGTCTPWSLAPDLIVPRQYFTVNLLNDGTPLLVGGMGYSSFLNTAELYDSSTAEWIPVGNMTFGRYYHAATLLANGKVLVSGGNSGSTALTAELYDPINKKWTQVTNMNYMREQHTSSLLADGRILVVGGIVSTKTAEIYNLTSNTWATVRNLNYDRTLHTACVLNDGRVLIIGGSIYPSTAEIYDVSTNTWTAVNNMTYERVGHTSTLLFNSTKVLVVGGNDQANQIPELYDILADTWTSITPVNYKRYQHTATLLFNGKLLIAGGTAKTDPNPTELYDPTTGQWTSAGSMLTTRKLHQTIQLSDGTVLVIGGARSDDTNLYDSVEIYHP